MLEPELCDELTRYYERTGGTDSGFMRTDQRYTALVCLLHEVTEVTRGRRFCTLPFLLDEDQGRRSR
ncbi:hypothetical protein ACSHWB_08130 [Lentzea sp. HUAS TT2]|uniref:hypothetical protein n=1 Tax=Lentzea sp. HUAS TT2 TaxID=3447454 RepID=UPI003F72CB09